MKKLAAIILSAVLFLPTAVTYGLTDDFILKDKVRNTYSGRAEASALIENLQFDDIAGHWAQEAVIRDGALNLVKGYGDAYQPESKVSNAEALAFVLRVIGRENEAVARGASMQVSPDSPLRSAWALGYLAVAADVGLITPEEYDAAITLPVIPADTTGVTPPVIVPPIFDAEAEATRERVADWVVRGLRTLDGAVLVRDAAATTGANPAANQGQTTANPAATTAAGNTTADPAADIPPDETAAPPNATMQGLFTYSDYQTVAPAYAEAVDMVTLHRIMNGDGSGRFHPKNGITRAEIAQMLKNMDTQYYNARGYEKKSGVVGATRDNQYETTGDKSTWRNIFVRTADGTMDNLQYTVHADNDLSGDMDAVVYKNGVVSGLAALAEGDEIEYIVNGATNQVLYVWSVRGGETKTLDAYLYEINVAEGTLNVRDDNENHLVYSMMEGIIANEGGVDYLRIDDDKQPVNKIQTGSILKLTLTNNIVTKLQFIGQPAVFQEIRGIVIENDPAFGYLTVLDNAGQAVTKYYYEGDMTVEKQTHYDTDDEIGYIDAVFPDFRYDPRDTDISAVEPGDLVFLRLASDDPTRITAISAAGNYVMKVGKIRQIANHPDYASFLIEYEDQQTAWFYAAGGVFVSKDGVPGAFTDIRIGDWAKLLVNQALLGPGNVAESVKEIALEGDEHFISGIVKGTLSDMNDIQNQLIIKDAYALEKTGWGDYRNLATYPLAGNETEYYYNDQRISLDYAKHYLKRSDATVYVALENNYTGDRVKKVTFRPERDEALAPDTVIRADGGSFGILSHPRDMRADSGTIVRRHGRLVDAQDIMGSDYARVVLSGADKAAVVDITDAPTTDGVMIARGRVLSVAEGESFTVRSMSVLAGSEWVYTPVEREFAIDHNTLFLNATGVTDRAQFIGYTDASVVDRVYNIVVDGSRAAYVVDTPYSTQSVRGTIYNVAEGIVYLKDASYYENDTGKWIDVSERNQTLTVALGAASLIAKNNGITTPSALESGDQIRVMTNNLPDNVAPGTQVNGHIVLVEQ